MTDRVFVDAPADVDLLDLDRWAREGAPHAWLAYRREHTPVWRHPSPGHHPGFWVVTGYDEVVALGRCPHVLSSDDDRGGVGGLGPGDELQAAFDQSRATAEGMERSLGRDVRQLLTIDPPEHTKLRKIVNRGFTPRQILKLEDRVRDTVDGLLAGPGPGASFDFTTTVSIPMPMRVIGDMIGVPRSQHQDLGRWSNEAVAATDLEYQAGPESTFNAVVSMFGLWDEVQAAHLEEPQDDLTTTLLDAEVDGESLSPLRFKMFLILLAVAGNETTRTAISHLVWELARHPEQWARLRQDPALIPTAVEEILRYASPVLYFRRNALDRLEVAGQHIEPGDVVSLWYVAANRDRARFADPDEFDVGRSPNPHVAFGGGGPHFCLGASLARLEIRVVLETLVERYARIEVVGPVERLRSNFLHGIKHLPVRLVP